MDAALGSRRMLVTRVSNAAAIPCWRPWPDIAPSHSRRPVAAAAERAPLRTASSRVEGRLSEKAWVGAPTTSRSKSYSSAGRAEATSTSRTRTPASMRPAATSRATSSVLPNIDS